MKLPWRVRRWIKRHSEHGEVCVNPYMTTLAMDPWAKGILTRCPCGAVGAW